MLNQIQTYAASKACSEISDFDKLCDQAQKECGSNRSSAFREFDKSKKLVEKCDVNRNSKDAGELKKVEEECSGGGSKPDKKNYGWWGLGAVATVGTAVFGGICCYFFKKSQRARTTTDGGKKCGI